MLARLRRPAVVIAMSMLALLATASAASGAAGAPAPQRRLLATTTLSSFRVVLTATRAGGSPPSATVTAAGYRPTAHGWKLIAIRQIGRRGAWSWFATQVCSLTVTQLKPRPSSAVKWDTMTVRLLWGPAIGCLKPATERWR